MKLKLSRCWPIILILVAFVGPPVAMLMYQSHRTGLPWTKILGRLFSRAGTRKTGLEGVTPAALPEGEQIDFLTSKPIGDDFEAPPRICHLEAVDLDKDKLLDILVCDAEKHRVSWIRQYPAGTFTEKVCAKDLIAPAHVEAIDIDEDGDLDLVVAVLGMLFPNNDKIGSIVILENQGDVTFKKHLIIDKIARVADVRAGDLDGDGDKDLVAGQFGYDDGETRWLENLGNWQFKSHILQTLSGPVNCEIVDIDTDGDGDIAVLVSQEWEEIYFFINDGKGQFTPRLIYGSTNDDFGSSGMLLCDFDKDGDQDILYTNGDCFDYIPPRPRPWHGVQWLENKGNLEFIFHRITDYMGAFSPRPADVDQDGDIDLFVASAFNWWEKPDSKSLIWLENDGTMRFRPRAITGTPTHILTLATGDFNGDGQVDLVTGGMHVYPPYDRMARVLLWTSQWQSVSKEK